MKLLINFLKMWAKPPVVTSAIIFLILLTPFQLLGILVEELSDKIVESIKSNF